MAGVGQQPAHLLGDRRELADGELDWGESARSAMRDRLFGFIERAGYSSAVLTERLVTPQDWADMLGTISYEILCLVGSLNPRVYEYK